MVRRNCRAPQGAWFDASGRGALAWRVRDHCEQLGMRPQDAMGTQLATDLRRARPRAGVAEAPAQINGGCIDRGVSAMTFEDVLIENLELSTRATWALTSSAR